MTDSADTSRGRLFVISAPSGAGKTSLTHAVIERLAGHGRQVCFSVSYTTRAPRAGETDGVDYHFIDEARFVAMIEAGAFLEHARVFDRRYGTGRAETERRLEAGLDVVLDIDWQGTRHRPGWAPRGVPPCSSAKWMRAKPVEARRSAPRQSAPRGWGGMRWSEVAFSHVRSS